MLGRGIGRRLRLGAVLIATFVGLLPGTAQAAFPGVNGKIAFERDEFSGIIIIIVLGEQTGSRQLDGESSPTQIFTMDPSGGGQTNVSQSDSIDISPNWSPDGKLITFSRRGEDKRGEIWVMNGDGSNQRKITEGPSDIHPAFAADGTHVLFVRDDAIWIVGTDGSNPHALFTPPSGHSYRSPAASPDGTRIAFVDRQFLSGFTEQIAIGNADGTGSPQTIPNQGSTRNTEPDWSPDNRQIVFTKGPGTSLSSQIGIIGADGSDPRTLTDPEEFQPDSQPHFSPDGAQVAFTRTTGFNIEVGIESRADGGLSIQSHIWVVPAAGGAAKQVTTQSDRFDFDPAWQPQPNLVSLAQVPPCSQGGAIPVTVTEQSGFKSPPSAVRFQIDGGPEQSAAVGGSPATALVNVPLGAHTLTYWGEDQAGYQEAEHHTASVLVDNAAPSVSIRIDQGRRVFRRGQKVTTTITASDSGSGLVTNPSRRRVRRSTRRLGVHTVRATAVDRCGNRRTRLIRYRVVAARKAKRRVTFTG